MNDEQWIELIERAVNRFRNETSDAVVPPKAYLILPQGRFDAGRCVEAMQLLKAEYRLVAVLPDEGCDGKAFCGTGLAETIKRSEAVFPAEDFVTVFPVVSRSLVVKTALCVSDDFETEWIAKCIAFGQPIYMQGEAPSFTGKEPDAYRRKIEACYRDVRAFGIRLGALPVGRGNPQGPVAPGSPRKKRVITAEDLDKLSPESVLALRSGDVVTALAAERAEERGIRILYR